MSRVGKVITGYSIEPTSMMCYGKWLEKKKKKPSLLNEISLNNLKNNSHKGKVSKSAEKKIRFAVNLLIASAENKMVWSREKNKYFKFKINFITLTLPSNQKHHDNDIKKYMLEPFLKYLRCQNKVKNYIWKAESQANGNIHFHITTDIFIHYQAIRTKWNSLCSKMDYVRPYQEKMKSLNLVEYGKLINKDGKKTLKEVAELFRYQNSINWSNPNTTDVHSVVKIRNLAGYLAKYMTKNDESRRKIEGMLWNCSKSLKRDKNLLKYDDFDNIYHEIDYIRQNAPFNNITDYCHSYYFDSQFLSKLPDCRIKQDWIALVQKTKGRYQSPEELII